MTETSYHIAYICSTCNIGTMQNFPRTIVYKSDKDKDKFLHECTHCGALAILNKQYPFTVHPETPDVPSTTQTDAQND